MVLGCVSILIQVMRVRSVCALANDARLDVSLSYIARATTISLESCNPELRDARKKSSVGLT